MLSQRSECGTNMAPQLISGLEAEPPPEELLRHVLRALEREGAGFSRRAVRSGI